MYQIHMLFLLFVNTPILRSLRTSPNDPEMIISSIRSGVVLARNSLMRSEQSTCDSFSGPFCGILGQPAPFSVSGLLDPVIWGGIRAEVYNNVYMKVSEYAQHHWSKSAKAKKRETRLTSLSQTSDGSVEFSPQSIAFESSLFRAGAEDSGYVFNSGFGYISFIKEEVSVVGFKVRAPAASHVLVRAYRDGLPVWSRMVPISSVSDVARPCVSVDPSLEAVDYMEVIGEGAEVLSLDLSLGKHGVVGVRNYLFLDENLSNPSRYYGIRSFPPSAYLLDMDAVLKEGLTVSGESRHILSAGEEETFSYEHFVKKMSTTPLEKFPSVQMEAFISALENQQWGKPSFPALFTSVLLDSSPELVEFVLRKEDWEADYSLNLNPFLTRLYAVKARSNASSEADPILATIASSVGNVTKMSFTRSDVGPAETLRNAANEVVQIMYAHLGDDRFTEIAIQSKLKRLAATRPVASDGIDEGILAEILIEGLELPIDSETPIESRREIFQTILQAVVSHSSSSAFSEDAIDQLSEILSHFT